MYNFSILVVGLVIQLIILVVWQIVDPFTLHTNVVDPINLIIEDSCSSSYGDVWYGIQIAYFSSLLIFGLIVVYFTWSVALSETKWMMISIYNYVIAGIFVVILLRLLALNDNGVFFVVCILNVCTVATSILSNVLPPLTKKIIKSVKESKKGFGFNIKKKWIEIQKTRINRQEK